MSDDELKAACEQLYDEQLVPSGRLAAVNALLRFARQQQAVGIRMVADPKWSDPFVAWCEAKATELEKS